MNSETDLFLDKYKKPEALRNQERIGPICVTANGKPEEKLLGIISAWDVAAND